MNGSQLFREILRSCRPPRRSTEKSIPHKKGSFRKISHRPPCVSGSGSDLDIPSLLPEKVTPFFRIHQCVRSLSSALQQRPVSPGEEHRDLFSFSRPFAKVIPASAVVIVSMRQKNSLQDDAFFRQSFLQALSSAGIHEKGAFRVIGMP